MFYKIMFVTTVLLASVNWAVAADLGNEEIAGIYLNMTVDEAKKTLEEQGYTEVQEKLNTTFFEKGNYFVHVTADAVNSRTLTKPSNLLKGISHSKNIRGLVYEAEKHDVAFCEIVPPLFNKHCSDEQTAKQRQCINSKDVRGALSIQFNMLQKEGNALSKDSFRYSAYYSESSSNLCQISLIRK